MGCPSTWRRGPRPGLPRQPSRARQSARSDWGARGCGGRSPAEPDNAHDRNAIAVDVPTGGTGFVGYVPRGLAETLPRFSMREGVHMQRRWSTFRVGPGLTASVQFDARRARSCLCEPVGGGDETASWAVAEAPESSHKGTDREPIRPRLSATPRSPQLQLMSPRVRPHPAET